MKNKLTLKSINEFAQQNPSLTYDEQLSYFGLGDGTKDNPYTWEEYCEIIDSVEPISSTFYFADGNGNVLCCLAEVVINFSGSSDESGENYEGTTYVDSYNINDSNTGVSIFDELYEEFENEVNDFAASASEYVAGLSTFPNAVANYQSGDPIDLSLNVNSIGLNLLTQEMLTYVSPSEYRINLLNPEIILAVLNRCPDTYSIAQYMSTALALGNITLVKLEENIYILKSDKYNFEMHEWRTSAGRNFCTLLGLVVNEGICLSVENLFAGLMGIIWGFSRRHITGKTTFDINFTGTLHLD